MTIVTGTRMKYTVGQRVVTTDGDFSVLRNRGKKEFHGVIAEISVGLYRIRIDDLVNSSTPILSFFEREILREERQEFMGFGVGDTVSPAKRREELHYKSTAYADKGVVTSVSDHGIGVRWHHAASSKAPSWTLYYTATTIADIRKVEVESTMGAGDKAIFFKALRVKDGKLLSRFATDKQYGPRLEYVPGEVTAAAKGTLGIYGYKTLQAAVSAEVCPELYQEGNQWGYTVEVWECEGYGPMKNAIDDSNGCNYRCAIPIKKVHPVEPEYKLRDEVLIQGTAFGGLIGTVTAIRRLSGKITELELAVKVHVRPENVKPVAPK